MIKKLLSIIVLGLLFSGNAYAGAMQELLDEKYKITQERLVEFNDRYAQLTFTLKKRNQVKICTVMINKVTGVSNNSICVTP
tara:strand:+ start:105 stop:350 length:246 start_codon:yes stop_codon:yes gene_type:complete